MFDDVQAVKNLLDFLNAYFDLLNNFGNFVHKYEVIIILFSAGYSAKKGYGSKTRRRRKNSKKTQQRTRK